MQEVLFNETLNTDGFITDFALGTTYSLNLDALLSIPLSLGFMGEIDEESRLSPHYLLEAIRQSTDRFVVFNNVGQITVPSKTNKLYSLLEKSLVQVKIPLMGKSFINFHPKVWILKESSTETEEHRIKVIVMSRNLSFSKDIDVVCELSGRIGKGKASAAKNKHKPLIDFVSYLANMTEGDLRMKIDSLIDDIAHVKKFALDENLFSDYEFFPMGISGYNGKETCLAKMKDKLRWSMIISPFVDMHTLTELSPKSYTNSKSTLITRQNNVTSDIVKQFDGEVYVVNGIMVDNNELNTNVDIHEKIYFTSDGSNNYMYLGSTNATENGFERNVEFLLKLKFKEYKKSYDSFKNEFIFDGKECIFEKATTYNNEPKHNEDIGDELLLKKAINSIGNANVTPTDDRFVVQVACDSDFEDVSLYPLYNSNMKQTFKKGLVFGDIQLSELTEFYVIEAGSIKRLIKIATNGIPLIKRDNSIFSSLIDTKDKFINYISFMISDDKEEFMCEQSCNEANHGGGKMSGLTMPGNNLYENMLKLVYSDVDRLKEIKDVIKKLDKNVVPQEFSSLYEKFENVIKKIKYKQ